MNGAIRGKRILSAAIDTCLLGILFLAEMFSVNIIVLLTVGEGDATGAIERRYWFVPWCWLGVCNALLLTCIFIEAQNGRTIGKRITGCVTRLESGARASRRLLGARCAIKYMPLIAYWVILEPVGALFNVDVFDFGDSHPYGRWVFAGFCVLTGVAIFGWSACLLAPANRSLHDRLTGTTVFDSTTPERQPRGFDIWPTEKTSAR